MSIIRIIKVAFSRAKGSFIHFDEQKEKLDLIPLEKVECSFV
jgi:hypothetical protein